jgi:L-asparaginase
LRVRRIVVIATGGTIEKTYNELTGELVNRHSIVRRMLRRLRFEDTVVSILELMSKDSLHLTLADRMRIVDVARTLAGHNPDSESGLSPDLSLSDPAGLSSVAKDSSTSGLVVLHGTDTLAETGDLIDREIAAPAIPIVLTGAIRPYEMKQSDALQNLNEAIFATGLLEPGVYCAAHGRVLPFPGVKKDRSIGTFVQI